MGLYHDVIVGLNTLTWVQASGFIHFKWLNQWGGELAENNLLCHSAMILSHKENMYIKWSCKVKFILKILYSAPV